MPMLNYSNMRSIEINDKKLVEVLQTRQEIFDRVQEINKKLMELDKERTKEAYKMEKTKDKTTDIINKYVKDLDEFEVLGRVYLNKEVPTLEILDQIEEYKKFIRDEKAKKNEKK